MGRKTDPRTGKVVVKMSTRSMFFVALLLVLALIMGCEGAGPAPSPASTTPLVPTSTAVAPATTPMPAPTAATTQTPMPATALDGRGGGFIAFYSERDGNAEIYIMNADGSAETRLTQDRALDMVPDLSPDGSRIVFVSDRDGNEEIYRMKRDGSDVVRLTDTPAQESYPLWSSDGAKDGSDNRSLIEASVGLNHHDWSPDAQKMAAVGYASQSTWSIYVFDVDDGNLTRLTNTSGVWDSEPSWSPDGTRIAFTRIYPDQDEREEVWVMDADGGDQHWVGVEGLAAKWSPDGSRFMYTSNRSGNYEIYTQLLQ
jgi:Tol biopolymer transport system component